jgi:hypothetical protein
MFNTTIAQKAKLGLLNKSKKAKQRERRVKKRKVTMNLLSDKEKRRFKIRDDKHKKAEKKEELKEKSRELDLLRNAAMRKNQNKKKRKLQAITAAAESAQQIQPDAFRVPGFSDSEDNNSEQKQPDTGVDEVDQKVMQSIIEERRALRPDVAQGRNPYLEVYAQAVADLGPKLDTVFDEQTSAEDREETVFHLDYSAVLRFAWCIPDERALQVFTHVGPVIEIGAGSGYWGALLRARNVEYKGYDVAVDKHSWTNILEGGPRVLSEVDNQRYETLFLCYPDDFQTSAASLALACLQRFNGDTVVLAGELLGSSMLENPWGKSASEDFQQHLAATFHMVLQVPLPSWLASRDTLTVWKRTATTMVGEAEFKNIPSGERLSQLQASPDFFHLLQAQEAPVFQDDSSSNEEENKNEDTSSSSSSSSSSDSDDS